MKIETTFKFSPLQVGDSFITHDWGVNEEVEVVQVMQQSIRLHRLDYEKPHKEFYWASPGLVNNHRGLKEMCITCQKKM